MSSRRFDELPPLFRSLGYDPQRESAALRHLGNGDADRCRNELEALAAGLRRPPRAVHPRAVEQLLFDLLQRLNRRLHAGRNDEAAYEETRAALIERFCGCNGPESAVRAFSRSLREMTAAHERRSARPHPLVERAKRHIEERYAERTSLSSIARELHVSPSYLSRLFRRETGMTLTSFIQRVRIDHARRLLGEADADRLSEIAYRVGYRNYRDFYRNFVRYERASPSDVRRRLSDAG